MTNLVEIRLDPRRLATWARNVGIDSADEGYVVHSAFCAAYGDLRPKPFVVKPGGPTIRVLGYSVPDAAKLAASRRASADPEVDSIFVSEVSKAMPENWSTGDVYAFETRVAPTRQRRARGGEVDAMAMAEEGREREDVYTEWLASRLGEAAEIRSSSLASFRKVDVKRRGNDGRGDRALRNAFALPDVVFQGVLQVKDPLLFGRLLEAGIGRHKAFGFGALLLRPAAG